MSRPSHSKKTEKAPASRSRWALGLEIGLWTAALLTVGIAAWMKIDAALYQHQAERRWAATTTQLPATVHRTPGDQARAPIDEGTLVGRLEIPRIGLDVLVAEGDSVTTLRRAVGHLPASARPGDHGNIALAGHRDTFFRPLEDVVVGDVIVLESEAGIERYEVEWTAVVEPTEVSMVDWGSEPALTLVTCYPFRFIGPAPQRFVVRARPLADV